VPFARNGEVELYYEGLGDASAPAVLLLNGAARQLIDSPDAYCDLLIAHGFRVIRFDQRDTGRSTGFAGTPSRLVEVAAGDVSAVAYGTDAMAQDALAVLHAAGVGRVHLFGRSLGGFVAQLLALDHPARVLSMTIAMAFSRSIGGSINPERLAQLESERFADGETFAARQVATARALGNPDYFDKEAIRAAALAAFARGVPEGSFGRHFAAGIAAPDLRARLAALRLPVQLIHGPIDKVIPLELARETESAIPGAKLAILDDMAHEAPPQLWDRWTRLFAANAAHSIEKT
jgi:pimeloyl-ACP methyl ester carboxylesterase